MSNEKDNTRFIIALGSALHRYGTPADRLEAALSNMCQILGLDARVLSTPTSIIIGFGEPEELRNTIIRADPGVHNLAKLADVDALTERVAAGEQGVDSAIEELERIRDRADIIGPLWTTLAFPVVCAASATFLGGSAMDLLAAGCAGLLIGLLALVAPRSAAGGRIFELVGALVAGGVAHIGAVLHPQVSYQIAMLAGLIVLVPGLTLTIAMVEIATRNLVSGTARLTAAAVVFLEILFGVALAEQVLSKIVGAPTMFQASPLPAWASVLALTGACLGVTSLFRAHPRDFPIIALTSVAAFFSARLGAAHLSPELGACAGGFVAAAIANLYARTQNRSAMVPLVPGLILLVPGSLGFQSLSSLWDQDVVGGIDAAFKMVVVAISLVAGILVANAIIAPRRSL